MHIEQDSTEDVGNHRENGRNQRAERGRHLDQPQASRSKDRATPGGCKREKREEDGEDRENRGNLPTSLTFCQHSLWLTATRAPERTENKGTG